MEVPPPPGVEVVTVGTALELREAMIEVGRRADVLVMAAAVADFRPAEVSQSKIKKGPDPDDDPTVRLVRNPDVLAELSATRGSGQVVVGFAAETGDDRGSVVDHARRKLAAKGCDLLVVNDVSAGRVFGRERNEIALLRPDGSVQPVPEGTKDEVADAVWDAVAAELTARGPAGRGVPDGVVASAGSQ
jgi:phosphopantothenoylcysteine decarboxylase/phosphopantothenate--cysteine ligase